MVERQDRRAQTRVNLAWSGAGPPAYPVFSVTEGLTSTAIETGATGPNDQRTLERAAAALLPLWTM